MALCPLLYPLTTGTKELSGSHPRSTSPTSPTSISEILPKMPSLPSVQPDVDFNIKATSSPTSAITDGGLVDFRASISPGTSGDFLNGAR